MKHIAIIITIQLICRPSHRLSNENRGLQTLLAFTTEHSMGFSSPPPETSSTRAVSGSASRRCSLSTSSPSTRSPSPPALAGESKGEDLHLPSPFAAGNALTQTIAGSSPQPQNPQRGTSDSGSEAVTGVGGASGFCCGTLSEVDLTPEPLVLAGETVTRVLSYEQEVWISL